MSGLLTVVIKTTLVSAASQSGSIEVSGEVPGPAPQSAAVIERPISGQKFDHSRITVSGTCPSNSFVQIFRNGIFAGAAVCQGNKFSLEINLVIGKNDLVAKVYDNLGQFGPDSAIVTVYYEPPTPPGLASLNSSDQPSTSPQLLLTMENFYRGVRAGKNLSFNVTIIGGQPPYAVVIKWGDNTESVYARASAGPFAADHIYGAGGVYNVSIEATDKVGDKAILQTVILAHGPPRPFSSTIERVFEYFSPLAVVWPLYLTVVGLVIGFWLGRHYQAHKFKSSKSRHKP